MMMKTLTDQPIRLMLTGGGTGGHLFPAIATAEEMRKRYPDTKVMFLGTRRKMDRVSLEGYGFEAASIRCYGLKGKKVGALVKALATLPISFFQAAGKIRSFDPDVVVGVGGYVTGPVMAAARLLGKKTVIHEQNSIPGMANRKLGSIVDRICISLPRCASFFAEEKTTLTGNPVRRQIVDLAVKLEGVQKKEYKTVLVLGGSQGAHRLNELVVEAFCEHGIGSAHRVIHQTGEADAEDVKAQYQSHGVAAMVEPFFRNMAEVYEQADLLISRAGATTLAELAVLGKPAILVPYPHAADDHQYENALYYVEGGGCRCFRESELNGALLARQVGELLADDEALALMSLQMRRLAYPQAAEKIVDVCLEQMNGQRRKEYV